MYTKISKFLLLFILFLTLIGCAAKVAPPLKDISNAKIALLNAKDSDAQKLAPESFNKAQSYYKDIKVFMDKKEYKKAQYAAQKAHIEAKLAYTKAKKSKIKKEVDRLDSEIKTIKKEFTTISE